MITNGMARAIEENEAAMRAIGLSGEDELQTAMQSLRGKPILRMIGELVAKVTKLERDISELKNEGRNDATDK
jgi:hypothetical protein